MKSCTINPQAQTDIAEIAEYLFFEGSEEISFRFLDAFWASAVFLSENPYLGRSAELQNLHELDIRIWRVKGFESWLIFYRPTEVGIEIFRILHGARDLPHEFEQTSW